MKPIQIGLLGLGTVGAGTLNVLHRNAQEISRRAGRNINIKRVLVRDLNKTRECSCEAIELTDQVDDILNDAQIDVVVELLGGIEAPLDYVQRALDAGKHVVTANKALIALHGNQIFAQAQQKGVMVAFEAAVAGGIPIIKTIREGLAANRIQSIVGIINGTSNYILTAMREQQRDFSDVLKEAQQLGYAEADPSFDIDGIDTAHKLTILASIAFGIPLQFEKVFIEGIRHITQTDIEYASQLGFCIKHLAFAKQHEEGIELRVHPTLISTDYLLAHVNGVMNAVRVDADALGPTLYHGAGAGAEPTASAVVADIIDVVRALTTDPQNRVPHLAFQADCLKDIPIRAMNDIESAYYLRLTVKDTAGVLAAITQILGAHHISIESLLQKDSANQQGQVPIVILTHRANELAMQMAKSAMQQINGVDENINLLRVEVL